MTNSQYSRRKTIEWNPVSADIMENVLEENICETVPLIEVNVVPNCLHACHWMKKLERVNVKFNCYKQKYSVIYKGKNLGRKSQELTNLKFSGRPFVSDSMSHRN